MALPYSNTTSGEKAAAELQKILMRFGCDRFGVMVDRGAGELICQFKYRERDVLVRASIKGYAKAWMDDNPLSSRSRTSKAQHESKAMEVASVAVYSIIRDWIKGQITAIETGVLSFEGAFLGQLMLGNGKTVLEHVEASKMLALEKK